MGKRWIVPYKRMVLEYAELIGKDVKSYREFGISKSSFYEWRKAFRENGSSGLIPKKPVAHHHPQALSQENVERILELRNTYSLGPQRIAWYLERYHSVKVSCASVYRALVRHGLRRLPRHVGRRAVDAKPIYCQRGGGEGAQFPIRKRSAHASLSWRRFRRMTIALEERRTKIKLKP